MSNRDKFLLVIIGIAAVVLLPYFLYIKDTRDKITNLDNQIVQLTDRYNELLEYEKNREMYEDGIVEYTEMRDEIIAKYPADIQQASQVMYLLNAEYSKVYESSSKEYEGHEDDEFEVKTVEPGIRFSQGQFGGNVLTPISSALLIEDGEEIQNVDTIVDTEYVALTNTTDLAFTCNNHTDVNHLLGYIRDDENNPMIYRKISFTMDDETGRVEGEMTLAQYAVTGGEDREFTPLPVDPDIDQMKRRGNEEFGIFGPHINLLKLLNQLAKEAEEAGDAADVDVVD